MFFLTSYQCNHSSQNKINIEKLSNEQITKDISYYKSKDYQIFSDYGFVIKAPCVLKDISMQSQGDFALNYGGIFNEDNPSKLVAYQLTIVQLPASYLHMSLSEQNRVKEKLESQIQKIGIFKEVKVGHEAYDGYLVESTKDSYKLKGEMFIKDDLIFGLTIITNDDIESKFNSYTNSLKFFEDDNISILNTKEDIVEIEKLELPNTGLTIMNPPCQFTKRNQTGHDFYYDGAINGNDKANAKVYKIMGNKLPMQYSNMILSDKEAIKKNLWNWANSKGKPQKMNNNCIYGLTFNYKEKGFNIEQAIILTDQYVYEIMIMSQLNITGELKKFLNNLSY